MGKFTNGLMIGVGVGLLVAPMSGEETRRLVRERVASIRASLPGSKQLLQKTSESASQAPYVLKNTMQQAATAGKQASKGVGEATRQTARSTPSTTSGTAILS